MTAYDLWKESGPVDALTEAEAEHVEDDGPDPDEAYDRMRLGE